MRPSALVPVAFAVLCLCATGCQTLRCGSCGPTCRGNTCDPCSGLSRTRLAQGGHFGHDQGACSTCNSGIGNGGILGAIRGRSLSGVGMCNGCGLRGRLGGQCGRCGLPLLAGPTAGTPYTDQFAGPMGPMAPTVGYPYYTTRAPRDFLMANPPTIGR